MSNIFSSGRVCRLGCLLAVAWLAHPADCVQAALLAYEPFEYGDVAVPAEGQYAVGSESAGTNVLGGQNPIIGPTAFYTGPWIQSGGDSQVVKPLPSLSYPNFQPGVGGVQQETVQFSCCSFGRTGRAIAGGLGGPADDRTLYESFLIDFGGQGTDDPAEFGKRAHELWDGGVGDTFSAVELFLNHFSGVTDLTLRVATPSGSNSIPVSGGGLTLTALTGVHLVVMKYEFDPAAPDVVSVYLDPTTFVEPATPDALISVAASDLRITHQGAYSQFTFSGGGHIPGAIDEIRWGERFFDVVPLVPEPTSLALLGAAMAAVCRRRRA